MKKIVEKVAVAAGLTALIVMGANRALADSNLYNEYTTPARQPTQTTSRHVHARSRRKGVKRVRHSAAQQLTPAQKRAHAIAKKRAIHSSIDNEIQDLSTDLQNHPDQSSNKPVARPNENQAQNLIAQNDDRQSDPPRRQGLKYIRVAGPQDTYAMTVPSESSSSTLTTKAEPVTPAEPESPYSGGVSFTMGHDNNIDPDKTGMASSYYAIEPTLGYKNDWFSATFAGAMKDYTVQTVSDTNKSSNAQLDMNFDFALSDIAKSTTTVEGVYHNEMMPNDYQGATLEGYDAGTAILYYDGKLQEKLAFDFGNGFKTEIGGFYLHRENTSYMTDYAADNLDPLFTTQSFNDYNGFAKVALEAGDYVELALRPQVDDKQFTEREARQPDGSTGGNVISAPLRHLITSELDFDVNMKVMGSTFGPTILVGQTSDESTGGEDNSFYGWGFKGDIVLVPEWKLTISPSVMYKHYNYDNWTYEVDWYNNMNVTGADRVDDQLDIAVNAKIMLTKNFGWSMGYKNSHYSSNWNDGNTWNGVNYNEEVYSTTAMFTF